MFRVMMKANCMMYDHKHHWIKCEFVNMKKKNLLCFVMFMLSIAFGKRLIHYFDYILYSSIDFFLTWAFKQMIRLNLNEFSTLLHVKLKKGLWWSQTHTFSDYSHLFRRKLNCSAIFCMRCKIIIEFALWMSSIRCKMIWVYFSRKEDKKKNKNKLHLVIGLRVSTSVSEVCIHCQALKCMYCNQ